MVAVAAVAAARLLHSDDPSLDHPLRRQRGQRGRQVAHCDPLQDTCDPVQRGAVRGRQHHDPGGMGRAMQPPAPHTPTRSRDLR